MGFCDGVVCPGELIAASMSRRWNEEDSPPPVDLRLVPPAGAVWAGCLIVLTGGPVAWWAAGLALLAFSAIFSMKNRWAFGALAASGYLATGLVVAAMGAGERAGDPLTAAAGHRSWSVLTVTVVDAQVAGRQWTSRAVATVYGQGSAWAAAIPGQVLRVSGRLDQEAVG